MQHKAPDMSKIPGGWEDNKEIELFNYKTPHIELLNNVISFRDVQEIIRYFSQSTNWQEVSVQGMTPEGTDYNSEIGSMRTTLFNPKLAEQIFNKFIEDKISNSFFTNPLTPTDHWQDNENEFNEWKLVGMSPMLRYMVYSKDGQHYPHYDAGYFYEDGDHRTLKSVVIYLTTNESGATRFIDDHQWGEFQKERKTEDWDRPAKEEEVYDQFLPKRGSILIFNHRLCHDVSQFIPKDSNEKRIIIRGDLIYKLRK